MKALLTAASRAITADLSILCFRHSAPNSGAQDFGPLRFREQGLVGIGQVAPNPTAFEF